MNKEKWYSIGYLALSILILLTVLGTAVWHFFHDHHDDTRRDSSARVDPVPHAAMDDNNDPTKNKGDGTVTDKTFMAGTVLLSDIQSDRDKGIEHLISKPIEKAWINHPSRRH